MQVSLDGLPERRAVSPGFCQTANASTDVTAQNCWYHFQSEDLPPGSIKNNREKYNLVNSFYIISNKSNHILRYWDEVRSKTISP